MSNVRQARKWPENVLCAEMSCNGLPQAEDRAMTADEVTWKHAETYFLANPHDLCKWMFQWAKKDDRKAARNIVTHWTLSQHPELKVVGRATLETWIEVFCSEEAYAHAYRGWREWYARRESA